MVRGVLLVPAKVFGLLSLGFILGGLYNLQEISFSFRGLFPIPIFFSHSGPRVDPFFFSLFLFLFYLYLLVEWQEVTKRLRTVRLGVGGVPLEKRLLQAV